VRKRSRAVFILIDVFNRPGFYVLPRFLSKNRFLLFGKRSGAVFILTDAVSRANFLLYRNFFRRIDVQFYENCAGWQGRCCERGILP